MPPGIVDARDMDVPPGNAPTRMFPVVHAGSIPGVNLDAWSLSTFGEVRRPREFRWAELLRLPREHRTVDLHCVAGWSVMGSVWEGVPLREILARSEPHNEATFIMFHCDGGYTTGVPLAIADDVLLAIRRNGEDLSPEHGYPLRVIVAGRYAWKSAKWLRRIELMPAERCGYREWYGYHNNADPWQEQRFTSAE